MAAPSITNLRSSFTYLENAIAAFIDSDVAFVDPDFNNYNGGTLTVTGLLAEDRVAINHQGTTSGLIGVSGANITFGGTVIGTFTGGIGTAFTVTFNANATTLAIDALIQNLTYANASEAPSAARNLLLNVRDATGADLGPKVGTPTFTELTGVDNPLSTGSFGGFAAPAFGDFDNDGDADIIVGTEDNGFLGAYRNDAGVYQGLGLDSPFAGISVGGNATPAMGDLDGDGDADLMVGDVTGFVRAFRNDGPGQPWVEFSIVNITGVDFGDNAAPALFDLNSDGDTDIVVGRASGSLVAFQNNAGAFTQLSGASDPFSTVTGITNARPGFADGDGDGDRDLFVGASDGTIRYYRNNGTGAFTAQSGAPNPFNGLDFGDEASPAFGDLDGDGDLDALVGELSGTARAFRNTTPHGREIVVNVTATEDPPQLSGVTPTATYIESNTPQILDADVTFTDPDGTSAGTRVTVIGFAGGDIISVRNQGTGAGQVGLSGWNITTGGTITYGGTTVATIAYPVIGHSVAETWITFSGAAATPTAVEAVIENLTYLSNDNPPSSRTLIINVVDFTGNFDLGPAAVMATFSPQTNTLLNIDAGNAAAPTFVDLTGDGRPEAVIGNALGQLVVYRNNGPGAAFTATTNPFASFDVGDFAAPTFIDVDWDGDLDAVVGNNLGSLMAYRNNGNQTYTDISASSSVSAFDVGTYAAPAAVDLDNDGDLDLVVGNGAGQVFAFRNDGPVTGFTELIGSANPFSGLNFVAFATPSFVDLDGDGDRDAVIGNSDNHLLRSFRNDGGGLFVEVNPIFVPGSDPRSGFVDSDGDGDLDMYVGNREGGLTFVRNDTPSGVAITLAITPVNDPASTSNLAGDVATFYSHGPSVRLDVGVNGGVSDVDSPDFDGGTLTLEVTGGAVAADDILSIANAAGVTVFGNEIRLGGTLIATMSGGSNGQPLVLQLVGTTFSGNFLNLMRAFEYRNVGENPALGQRTITWTLVDGDGTANGGNDTLAFTSFVDVVAANQAPVIDVGSEAEGIPGSPIQLTGIMVTDSDGTPGAGGEITVRFFVEHGTLTIRTNVSGGISSINTSGQGSNGLTITGTPAQFNATLAQADGLVYTPDAGFAGIDGLIVSAFDGHRFDPPALEAPVDMVSALSPATTDLAGIVAADIDDDGKLDLVYAAAGGTQIAFRLGSGDGSFGVESFLGGALNPARITIADIDNDGFLDILVANNDAAGGVGVYRGSGGGAFASIESLAGIPHAVDVVEGDLNGDGRLDLVVANGDAGTAHAMLQNADGSFAAPLTQAVGAHDTRRLLLGDVNNDGHLDLIAINPAVGISGSSPGTITRSLGNGDGTFGAALTLANEVLPWDAVVGDFTHDGNLDIAYVSQDEVTLLRGNGTGTFNSTATGTSGLVQSPLGAGDFNGDGVLDFATGGSGASAALRIYPLHFTSFGFPSSTSFASGTNPASIAVGDFDGDGDADLAIADAASNIVSVRLNATAGRGDVDVKTIAVISPSVLDLNGAAAGTDNAAVFAENEGSVLLAPDATISDPNSPTLQGATITIFSGKEAGDELAIDGATSGTTGSGIAFAYDSGTGAMTLNGEASVADYQAALRTIAFQSDSNTFADPARTIGWTLDDGSSDSEPRTTSLTVTAENDAPVLTAPTAATVTFTENQSPAALFAGVNLDDPDVPDASFDSATLTVGISGSSGVLDFLAGSRFSVQGEDPDPTMVFDSITNAVIGEIGGTGTRSITISEFTPAATEAVLTALIQAFGFSIDGDNVTSGSRTATVTFADGGNGGGDELSDFRAQTVQLVGVNDPPTGTDDTVTIAEDSIYEIDEDDLGLSDPESDDILVAITAVSGGTLYLDDENNGFDEGDAVTSFPTDAIHPITFALGLVGFRPNANTHGDGIASVTFVASDEEAADPTPNVLTFNVTPVPDAPVNTVPAAQAGTEDADFVFSIANGNAISVGDVDGDPLNVTVYVQHGTLTPATGPGGGSNILSLSGTAAQVNAALNGLVYRGDLDYFGEDNLVIYTSDGFQSFSVEEDGSLIFTTDPGVLSDGDSVAITLAPDGHIDGTPGDDGLNGTGGADIINGRAGNDTMTGGAGADTMTGGPGNDIYIVDNMSDVVVEDLAGGTDEVRTNLGSKAPPDRLIYVIPDFVENLTGTAVGNQGVGDNALDNVINMGSGHDLIVVDAGGVDTINAGGGHDFIYYGDKLTADDVTNGGAGTDTIGLIGDYGSGLTFTASNLVGIERMSVFTSLFLPGTGPNNYYINMHDANVVNGTEFFVTAASLQSNEALIFNGSAELGGRFTIHGGAGSDILVGGAGNDFLIGNAGNDQFYGLSGNDTMTGGLGADKLRGGGGGDTFRYTSTDQSTLASMDEIFDLRHIDRIDLSAIDADGNAGNGNTAFAFIGASAFSNVAGQLRATNITSNVWRVEGDTDGNGVADLVIQVRLLDPAPLGAGDFNL